LPPPEDPARQLGVAATHAREEVEWDEKARAFKKTPEHNWASHGADAWRYLSLSWREPMRELEPEKKPAGIPLPSMHFDQLHDLENDWSMREERV
jgi:phage terminase large subunit